MKQHWSTGTGQRGHGLDTCGGTYRLSGAVNNPRAVSELWRAMRLYDCARYVGSGRRLPNPPPFSVPIEALSRASLETRGRGGGRRFGRPARAIGKASNTLQVDPEGFWPTPAERGRDVSGAARWAGVGLLWVDNMPTV